MGRRGGVDMLPEDTSRMAELETLYVRHVDTVYRICYSFLKNQSDAEDAVQETFLSCCKFCSKASHLQMKHMKKHG